MSDDGSRYAACRRPKSRTETIDDSCRLPPQTDPHEALASRSGIWTARAADAYYYALKPLEELYGELEVGEFGPRQLKVVQAHMIRAGNARTYANDRVGWIKRCFKWTVSEGLAPASVYQGLQAVAGLRAGYQDVRETEKVGPVPSEHIEAVKAFVRPEIADLIELQLATAMRSGEMLSMTRCQLDISRDPWEFEPHQHKSKHRGRPRKIYIGPRGHVLVQREMECRHFPNVTRTSSAGSALRPLGRPRTAPSCLSAIS